MSVKDLNLSLDRELAHDTSGIEGNSAASRRSGPKRLKSVAATASGGEKKVARRTPTGKGARFWVAPALIALVNMLFLVLAGFWLTAPRVAPMPMDAAAADLSRLQVQLDVVQEQLVAVQTALEEQQKLLLLRTFEASQAVAPQAAAAPPADAAVEKTPTPPTWQIHLGHFTSRDEAVALQIDLKKLGYTANIAAADTPGEPGVSLQLGGFDERKHAELAAKDIMQRTRLNGLWVSTSE